MERIAIKKEDLGKARHIDFFKNGKPVKNSPKANEVFYSIKKLNGKKSQGYIVVTDAMRKIFNTLIQDRPSAMSIEFIEWSDDTYNVVFKDGLCISYKYCSLSKKDFAAWEYGIEFA